MINSHKHVPISPMDAGRATMVEKTVFEKPGYRKPPKKVMR
tara:strand:- start:56 stop:178 length:123 start_codon:yes stop_codon:yes gene_type:complete